MANCSFPHLQNNYWYRFKASGENWRRVNIVAGLNRFNSTRTKTGVDHLAGKMARVQSAMVCLLTDFPGDLKSTGVIRISDSADARFEVRTIHIASFL
jgi:hypothetical protein